MNILVEIFTSKFVYVPFLLWFIVQLFKVVYELVTTKKFNFRRIIGAGGMPSSHSAITCSLSTLIGRYEGFGSPIFAISLIFALIVMYDASGVRRAAGKQATILNKLIQTPNLSPIEVQERLVEALGHTPVQVFIGAFIGIMVGFIA